MRIDWDWEVGASGSGFRLDDAIATILAKVFRWVPYKRLKRSSLT